MTADRHWAISEDGRPLVTIPAGRQMFLKETTGEVVFMGCRTLEGLLRRQPSGNRVNIVLTHDMQYKVKGAVVCHSLGEALKTPENYDESDIYIIEGKSIYRQFPPYCTTAHVTSTDYTYDGDAYPPDSEKKRDGIWRKRVMNRLTLASVIPPGGSRERSNKKIVQHAEKEEIIFGKI